MHVVGKVRKLRKNRLIEARGQNVRNDDNRMITFLLQSIGRFFFLLNNML